MIYLPVLNSPRSYRFTTTLEGVVYQFQFEYNARTDRWSMTVADSNGSPFVSGIVLLNKQESICQYPDRGLPPGLLYPVDESGFGENPNGTNFGVTAKLVYIESADLV